MKEGIVREFIDRQVPADWHKWDLGRRRIFWNGAAKEGLSLVDREKICAAEIYVECFNGDVKYMKKVDSVEINSILESLNEWKRDEKVRLQFHIGIM